ncbi:DUF6862 domain-containing protein, partial [Ralstonia nicotianae]
KLILYRNAADYAKAHNIQLGQALTQQQIAQLDKPMLWYVTQQVPDPNCNTVASTACPMVSALVPQLYLPAGYADAITQPAGGMIAGTNVNVNVDGTLRNSGQIVAGDALNVHAGTIDARPNVVNVGTSAYKVEGGWLEVSGTQVQPGGFMSAVNLNITANAINAINEAFIVRNADGTTNREASNALVAQLKANLGLNYTSGTVKDDIHQNFIKEDGPLPSWVGAVVAVVAVAISIVTAGAGAGLMVIMMTGMLSSVASQALTTGKVNLGQAVTAGVVAVVTAGLTQGALSALNLSSVGASTIGNNIATGSWSAAQSNLGSYFAASVVRSAISAGVSTVAYGGSFGQAFANGMVQSAAALGANAIGTLSPGIGEVNASTNSIVGNILGHVALGCAISSVQGTGCAGGAAGGFAGSVVAPLVGSGLYSGASGENRAIDAATVAIAGLAGGAIAQAIGGDAAAGASTGQNAATNNWLEHRAPFKGAYSEQERRDRAAAACKDDPKQCDVANDWDAKSKQRNADLQAACANLSSDTCRGAMAVAKAAGNNIVFAGGKVYAYGPEESVARSLDPSPAAKTLDTMVGSPLAGIFGGIPYFKSNADPAAGYYFAQYGMALEGIGAGVLGLPMGPLAGPGWRATLESPNTLYVGSGSGSAFPTWTNVAGPYSVIGQGGGAATTVQAGPGYAANDVLRLVGPTNGSSNSAATIGQSAANNPFALTSAELAGGGTIINVNPADLRWTQTTAGGNGRADALRQSIAQNGYAGAPIDVVQTTAGIVTVDHTRAAVALEQGITSIPARVHLPSDPLPADMAGRFGSATTWGEAAAYRAANQRPPLPSTGTTTPPKLPAPKIGG